MATNPPAPPAPPVLPLDPAAKLSTPAFMAILNELNVTEAPETHNGN